MLPRTSLAVEYVVNLVQENKLDEARAKLKEFSHVIYAKNYQHSVVCDAIERLACNGNTVGVNFLIDEFSGDYNVAAVCYAHFHHEDCLQALIDKAAHCGASINFSMIAAEYAQQGRVEKVDELLKRDDINFETVERGYRNGGHNHLASLVVERFTNIILRKNIIIKKEILSNLYQKSDKSRAESGELIDILRNSDLMQKIIDTKLNANTRTVITIINELKSDFRDVMHDMQEYQLDFDTAYYFNVLQASAVAFVYDAATTPLWLAEQATLLGLPEDCVEKVLPVFRLKYATMTGAGQGLFNINRDETATDVGWVERSETQQSRKI